MKTRNNHYVPQWYQTGFFEPGLNTLAYLDLTPPKHIRSDGSVKLGRSVFSAPTARAFWKRDLYSTFFGTLVNDEIERKLFGNIDAKGSRAVRAYTMDDAAAWYRHFHTLFEFINIQKLRTPKGLDWLRARYPTLTQNDLMFEMQGLRAIHCTIWSESVRELVSAEDAGVKFLLSDHPVTIYNHAVRPEDSLCSYPLDPDITLKASQTIFPLNRDWCLILTNLEYAQDIAANPLEKRTFARNYRQSMVRTDAFIRTRRLTDAEVAKVNYILKARACRYVAAGKEEWLYPERVVTDRWSDLRGVLRPQDELWHFGGEIYAQFEDGHVHYQDAFGRTEKPREFLLKSANNKSRPGSPCGCGSGRRFKDCCQSRPDALRPSWTERSIRERNIFLCHAIGKILGVDQGKDWTEIRRDLTDDQISEVYSLYDLLWPLETDLLQLLPKPDGVSRAVYTGSLHPESICEFALGSALYFDELIVQTPFQHPANLAKEYNPIENPRAYRQEFLKTVLFFLTVMPLVELGLVNLIPDPCDFDHHLRRQMMRMAEERCAGMEVELRKEVRAKDLFRKDFQRNLLSLPRDALSAQMRNACPELDDTQLEKMLHYMERLRESDPLAVLQTDSLEAGSGGQISLMKLAPNFEMAMYLAQATGACIVTDSQFRWSEILGAMRVPREGPPFYLTSLARAMMQADFLFLANPFDIAALSRETALAAYPAIMRSAFRYMSAAGSRGVKPNVEARLASQFGKSHLMAQRLLERSGMYANRAKLKCAFPVTGIQDHTVNRLLLMSNAEHHLPNVPMAFFIHGLDEQAKSELPGLP